MSLGGNHSRALVLAALFICCAGAAGNAGTPGEPEETGRPQPPATAPQTAGGVGSHATGPSHGFIRLQCRRYFGCTPASRTPIGFTRD